MAPSASYLAYVKDLFSPFGEITTRRMFGGAGVYCDGLIFAIVAQDDIWLKADKETADEFSAAGSQPFTIEMKGKTGTMSFYSAPEDIFDDEGALRRWAELALAAAARARKPARKKA
mgnify:CR=1 FL=1